MSSSQGGAPAQESERALCSLENLIWRARYYRKDLSRLIRREQALLILHRANLAGESKRVSAAAFALLNSGILLGSDLLNLQSRPRL